MDSRESYGATLLLQADTVDALKNFLARHRAKDVIWDFGDGNHSAHAMLGTCDEFSIRIATHSQALAQLTMARDTVIYTPPIPPGEPTTLNADMDFDGFVYFESILSAYGGGTGGAGTSKDHYGVDFYDNAVVVESAEVSFLFWITGAGTTLNVAAGFISGVDFDYGKISGDASLSVYSDVDGGGDLLATVDLDEASYPDFVNAYLHFTGVGKSIVIVGENNSLAFDNLKLVVYPPLA